MVTANEAIREWQLYSAGIDPIARDVLATVDPWTAYDHANAVPVVLLDHLEWLPHGGAVYSAWAELTDLYEIGGVDADVAYAVLRQAASHWLEHGEVPPEHFLDRWTEDVRSGVSAAWRSPWPARPTEA